MSGLEPNLDLKPLMGRQVLQLCFGRHQLQFHFDGDARILVESECRIRESSSKWQAVDNYLESATSICRTIDSRIVKASRSNDGGLLLSFDNGIEFEITIDSPDSDSFQLVLEGVTFAA